jgi:tRNA modification GTPase
VGRVGAGLGDEVVAVVLGGDPPEVEIHCHGGPAPLALVIEAFVSRGALPALSEEWLSRSPRPRLAVEAEMDLARAPTARAAEILLEQAGGAFEAELRGVLASLPADPGLAVASLDALLRNAGVGLRLIDGWRIALAGRPNVGKSRLLNALAGYDRAIVDATPGTTRDVVTVRTAFDGWPIELADTAGLRQASDPIEAAGVALARTRQRGADLVLLVLDRSEPLSELDRSLIVEYPKALLVANKSDLPLAWDAEAMGASTVSAATGEGIEGLIRGVTGRLVPEPPPPGAAVPFRPRQVGRLDRARRLAAAGRLGGANRGIGGLLGPGRSGVAGASSGC